MGYTRGTRWTDEKIEDSVRAVMKSKNLLFFPTHSQMASAMGDESLANAVAKHGGTKKLAKKFGIPIDSNCETEFGDKYEKLAIHEIKENVGIDSIQTNTKYPYDLLTDGAIKIDVKSALPWYHKNSDFPMWSFNLEKKLQTCDVFIIYCVQKDETIYKRVIVPSNILSGQTQVGISTLSRYDSFIDRWDIIRSFDEFYQSLKNNNSFICKRRSKRS